MFYSSNPGERVSFLVEFSSQKHFVSNEYVALIVHVFCHVQVKITDMQVRGTTRNLLPGYPHCAPACVALGQTIVEVVRALHREGSTWTQIINTALQVHNSV